MRLTASILLALSTTAASFGQAPTDTKAPATIAPATPGAAHAAPARFASVDALLLVDLLIDAEPIKSERTARGKACQDTFNAEQKKLMDIEAKLLMGAQDDPKRPDMIKEWEQRKKSLNDVQTKLTSDYDRYNSLKAAEAWKHLVPVVKEIATRAGYTHVLAARQNMDFVAESQSTTVQQLLSRELVVYPEADDLTARVIEELKLQPQLEAKRASEARTAAEADAFMKQPAPAPPADPKDAPKIPMAPKDPPAKDAAPKRPGGLPDRAPGFPAPAEAPKQPK